MPQPLTDAINALTAYATTVTGKSPPDTTLSDAVATLASGYGGGGISIDDVATRNFPNDITIDADISAYAFKNGNLKNVTITSGKKIGMYTFENSTIETLHAPLLTTVGDADYAFNGCDKLTTVEYGANGIGGRTFQNCRALTVLVFKEATLVYTEAFKNDIALEVIDFCKLTGLIRQNTFNGCTVLNNIIIRTQSVATLSNINSFTNTPFASGKAGGTLYVPQSLISSYQTASNWSTILGYATNSIKSIESTHTDPNAPIDLTLYYADGTPIE